MFEKNFCSSPWIHARINNNGSFEYCRWADKSQREHSDRIQNQSVITWFQRGMSPIREQLLQGHRPEGCKPCHDMEAHGKVSGRQKQLLKVGVSDPFDKTMLSSPWLDEFRQAQQRSGDTDLLPQDWQIDLGNYCNSACLFCTPHSSSRLAQDYLRLGRIKQLPPRAWCDDPKLLNEFVDMLSRSPGLAYLHFIGGETMITPAFRRILEAMIAVGLNRRVTIGFTTNLTVWDDDITELLNQFQGVNLGLSVECMSELNDYLRWPSDWPTTQELLERWIKVGESRSWFMQLRVTPTLFSIWHLDSVYRFALQNGLAVESCDFLNEPAWMRITLLPENLRQVARQRLLAVMEDVPVTSMLINTRHPDRYREQINQDCASYVSYLETAPDESHRLPELIKYLHDMEGLRGNSILKYLPEYEEFLRTAGY